MNLKNDLRKVLKRKRLSISLKRREEAKKRAFNELYPYLKSFNMVLSFSPLSEEIDLCPLNMQLAGEGRLTLPVCEENGDLIPYLVSNLRNELQINPKTGVYEPIQGECKKLSLDQLEAILVPGLGFDSNKHRLGFGKGYYDRFLKEMTCPIYGIGFKEQLLKTSIPNEGHDVALTEIFVF